MNINSVHVHLLINHFPLFGLFFVFIFFIFSLVKASEHLLKYSYIFTLLIAFISIVVYRTGMPAMSYIHFMPGFSEQAVSEHIQSAQKSIYLLLILSLSTLINLFFVYKKKSIPKFLTSLHGIALFVALIGVGYVTHTGGKIRHPEAVDGISQPVLDQQEVPEEVD